MKRATKRRLIGIFVGLIISILGVYLDMRSIYPFILLSLCIGIPMVGISLCNLMDPDDFTNEDHIQFLRRYM